MEKDFLNNDLEIRELNVLASKYDEVFPTTDLTEGEIVDKLIEIAELVLIQLNLIFPT